MEGSEKLLKIFQYALNQEETGKNFFQQSLQRLGYGAAVTAFKRLIQEEQKHIEFLNNLMNNIKAGKPIALAEVEEVTLPQVDYFDARAQSEFLQQCVENSMVPDVTIFNLAWLIEKDLSDFYRQMAEKTEREARAALNMLAEWEAKHERFFRQFRDALSEAYSRMPWGG